MRRFRPQALALLICAASLGLTYLLWWHEQHNAVLDRQANFDFNLYEDISRIEQRMAAYEQVLRGAQGLLNASDNMRRREFQIYVDSLQLGANFFGIQGVGIISIVPHAQKNAHIAAIRRLGFPEYTIKPAGEREVSVKASCIQKGLRGKIWRLIWQRTQTGSAQIRGEISGEQCS